MSNSRYGTTTWLDIWLQQSWLCFKKIKTQTLWLVQKLKSKTNLRRSFLIFWAVSCVFCFEVWKSANMTYSKTFLFWKNQKGTKNAVFQADFKSIEKVWKNAQKVISKPICWRWVKVGKAHISVTFSLITFLVHFWQPFQSILISIIFCVFWHPNLKNFEGKRAWNCKKNVLYKRVLELNFAIINGGRRTTMLKSLYPSTVNNLRTKNTISIKEFPGGIKHIVPPHVYCWSSYDSWQNRRHIFYISNYSTTEYNIPVTIRPNVNEKASK